MIQPMGYLTDLFGQAQKHQPVFLGEFSHTALRHARQHLAQRDHPLCPAGGHEDLRAGLVQSAEDIVERIDAGGDNQLQRSMRRAQVEPRQGRKRDAGYRRAIHQHHVSQRAGLAFQQAGDVARLGDAEAGAKGVFTHLFAQGWPVGEDGEREAQAGGVVGRGAIGEIVREICWAGKLGFGHETDSVVLHRKLEQIRIMSNKMRTFVDRKRCECGSRMEGMGCLGMGWVTAGCRVAGV